MTSAEPVTAVGTLEKLAKLTRARVSATSPHSRVRVTLSNGRYEVELRREGFRDVDPRQLAEEVAQAVRGTLRGFRQHEHKVLSEYRKVRQDVPQRLDDREREHLRRAQSGVMAKAESPTRMVRGSWDATRGLRLKLVAVNESHRVQLAGEITTVLNELSETFRARMREATRQARRELREESR